LAGLAEADDTDADAPASLGDLLGDTPTALSPEAVRTRILVAVRDLVLARARRQPLVLAVENVHWIDRGSAAWLQGLLGHREAPILVLATCRPEREPGWLARSG